MHKLLSGASGQMAGPFSGKEEIRDSFRFGQVTLEVLVNVPLSHGLGQVTGGVCREGERAWDCDRALWWV